LDFHKLNSILGYINTYKTKILNKIMAELVALLSKGEGTWAQVAGIIKQGDWENIILVGTDFAKNFEITTTRLADMKEELQQKLAKEIKTLEVSLSIASGDGKEHMALISALLSIPVGVRFTALTKEGIVML
jgi:GTPase Era involved in 16S rRNA processing